MLSDAEVRAAKGRSLVPGGAVGRVKNDLIVGCCEQLRR